MRLFLFTPPTTLPNEHAALHSLAARAKSCSGFALPAALHVRKPGADAASVEDYLKGLPEALLERAVLHSHHALASKFDIQGIHFTEAARSALPGGRPKRPEAKGGALRGRLLTLSTSLHSCAEVEAEAAAAAAAAATAAAQGRELPDPAYAPSCSFDYVFLSPLFESISKPGYGGKREGSGASVQFWRSGGGDDGEGQGSSSSCPSPALTAALLSARESRRLGVVALGGIEASRLGLVSGLGFEAAAVLGAVWGSEDPVEAWAEVVKEAAAAAAAAAAATAPS